MNQLEQNTSEGNLSQKVIPKDGYLLGNQEKVHPREI